MTEDTETPTAVEAIGLGKRLGGDWALRGCGFRLPAGSVCALAGPNGAGKSTLLSLAAGLTAPNEGRIRTFGQPATDERLLPRVALVAQDKPLYPQLTVAETLRLGRELNPVWDQKLAERVVADGEVGSRTRIGSLSIGQRTCVALALALGKRADLLLLDEPLADQDPLRRSRMLSTLMVEAAEHGITLVMATHNLAELYGSCDHLVLLGGGAVRLAGEVTELLEAHQLVTMPLAAEDAPPDLAPRTVVETRRAGRQFTALVRTDPTPTPSDGHTGLAEQDHRTEAPSLEEILLGYLRSPHTPPLFTDSARPGTLEAAV